MAKHNFLRSIGFTFCSLLTIFVLILLFFPNLMSIGQNVAPSKRKSKDTDQIFDIPYYTEFRKENQNQVFHEFDSTKQKDRNEIREILFLEELSKHLRLGHPSHQELTKTDSNSDNKIISFNLKLNSFSKESTDILD